MKYGMLPQDAEQYESEIRGYVSGLLGPSLFAEVDMDHAREHTNKTLLKKLLGNPELRDEIVERIVDHSIKYSMGAYKTNLTSDVRKAVFMRKIYSFINMYQISLLAVHFDKQIEEEKSQKHSR